MSTVHSRRVDLLRERHGNATVSTTVFNWLLVAAMLAIFWQHSPQRELLIWAGLNIGASIWLLLLRRRQLSFERWYPFEIVVQIFSGVGWGLICIIAMPADDVHQALLAGLLGCVMVAASTGESQFRTSYLSFVVTKTALVAFGFFIYPGANVKAAGVYLFAVVFSLAVADDDRRLHLRLADVTIENDQLVAQLEEEHKTLASLNARLDNLAWTDALTGLANRAAGTRHLMHCLTNLNKDGPPLTVAFLDLNGFKQINDEYGHGAGDQALVAVADRLRTTCTDDEIACRFGGDELILISPAAEPNELGARIADTFSEPFSIAGRIMNISSAIGLATAHEACSADELLQQADTALYRHKREAQQGRWVRFTEPLPDSAGFHAPVTSDVHGS